jgi:hypothetical protein
MRPSGNTALTKNNFGLASSYVSVKCQEARIYFQNTTNVSYCGSTGLLVASTLRVIYPMDETYNIPTPFEIANYATALVPISYSSPNYQFVQNAIYDYDNGNNTLVRVNYQLFRVFPVYCNIDLQPLQCEINTLIDNVQYGKCSDVASDLKKLNLITGKFTLVCMGIMQPLTGVDVPSLIEEIKEIGGWDCDCCNAQSGIIPTTASIVDGYSFSVNSVGGDVRGSFTTNGSNIQLNIADTSYIVTVCNDSPSTVSAFSFKAINGAQSTFDLSFDQTFNGAIYTKTYCMQVDGTQLARDVLANIANDAYSLNYLNNLITGQSGNFELAVDGGCVFNSNITCDYSFTLNNTPTSGSTYALLTSIRTAATVIPLSFSYNQGNISALQAYLNDATKHNNLGIFSVTDAGSGNLTVASTSNTFDLSNLSFKVGGTVYIAAETKTCTGVSPLSANQVVQNIINYLCGINDTQLATSQAYEIGYINPLTGVASTATVANGVELNIFITTLLQSNQYTIQYIESLGAVNCASVQALYRYNSNLLKQGDWLNGSKSGSCAEIDPMELLSMQLTTLLSTKDATTLNALCSLIQLCSANGNCLPLVFGVSTVPYSLSCPYLYEFNYTLASGSVTVTSVVFGNALTSGTTQTVGIYYKLHTDTSYTTKNATTTVNASGSSSPVCQLASPETISGLTSGSQYDIKVTMNCSSPLEYVIITVTIP